MTDNKTTRMQQLVNELNEASEAYYNGHASTLEGIENLKNRLEAHNASVTCKLYESHHYQYIPDMLVEYLKDTYPPE